jgi:N-acetylmuramoyl-L-alanine amidase
MRFITIHNTGNSSIGANAKAHANYIKGDTAANAPVSWHYTVDDKCIFQHIPDNEDAFHAGDGAGDGNRKSIGIEICMNADGDLIKATDNAAELTASLCRKYCIPTENIRQHQQWSGKNCPQMIRRNEPYSWNDFILKVKEFLTPQPEKSKEDISMPKKDNPSPWAANVCLAAKDSGLILGDGSGFFGWQEPLTLERMLVIISKPEYAEFLRIMQKKEG